MTSGRTVMHCGRAKEAAIAFWSGCLLWLLGPANNALSTSL